MLLLMMNANKLKLLLEDSMRMGIWKIQKEGSILGWMTVLMIGLMSFLQEFNPVVKWSIISNVVALLQMKDLMTSMTLSSKISITKHHFMRLQDYYELNHYHF
jgi:hypothetical protein